MSLLHGFGQEPEPDDLGDVLTLLVCVFVAAVIVGVLAMVTP